MNILKQFGRKINGTLETFNRIVSFQTASTVWDHT